MCPICLSILIEPVSLPCKHVLCMPCFRSNIEESSMCCPMCRVRIATWSRQASRKKCLVDEKRWQQIKTLFPDHVQKRLDGTDDTDEDLRASSRASSCLRLAEPGEIRKEYEKELKKVAEEEEARKQAELEASETLVRKLQEEELRKVNKWQNEKANAEQTDEELARQLEEALRKEVVSPPGVRTTRHRPPTLLDKFVSRSRRPSSCDTSPQVQSAKPALRPSSASLFFPCSKSRTKPKSQIRQEKCATAGTSDAGHFLETSSSNVVVDSQQPSTSAAYSDMQKPPGSGGLGETCLPGRNVVKSSAKMSSENFVTAPNVFEYLQGVVPIEKSMESDTGLINVEGKLCIAGDKEKLLGRQPAKSFGSGASRLDLQKTCANLAEHIFKSSAVFPGEDFQNLYPHLTSPPSNRSSSLYSPLLIDESKVKELDSPVPDVMLSSCANMSEVSATKSPSVREVIVLSSDSEMSRESSVVPIMSIPVINITDSSENNTPVPSSSGAGASGDASTKHSLRSLSVTVERLPTPSFALLHQSSEDEPCTSSQEKRKRSMSVESSDSISHELVHFKPIQICPRTPPKRLPNGKAIKPPFVVCTPLNLKKRLCQSPPLHSIPQASMELSPVIKRQLQTLAAERLQQVQVHSKGIETDGDLVPHPLSPSQPRTSLSNCKPPEPALTQASKKLNFDGSGDSSVGVNRRHFAQIADFIEQNRMESFTLPEDFNVVNTTCITKNHQADSVKNEPLVVQAEKMATNNFEVPKCVENSVESVKKSPARVYSMRRNKKRVRNSQECSAESVKKKSLGQDSPGTPSGIRTIEDWIRSSQERQKSDLKNMIDTELSTTCTPPKKRLRTRGANYYNADTNDRLCTENNRKTDLKIRGSHGDTVQYGNGEKVTTGKLKKVKQSKSQTNLEFAREQRLKSDCDSDCSSIGERVAKNRKCRKTRSNVAKEKKKRKFSEFEQASDEMFGKKSGDSGAADLADEDVDLETMDRRLALKLQEQFNFEAKSQVSMYRLRGSSEEYSFRRRARSSATINSQAS
ncbi:uncharacterized protein LOC135494397 [Lineus longissimus]|uniref:uncharacterized protein LOC135494397 n=1 Tax=Lineus longissimus TaxID=88925 RepID=UPI00315C7AE0